MSLKIDQDYGRFRNIVRGKIREGLRKYISQGDMIGGKGKELVSIPIPQIDIPRFTFDGCHSGERADDPRGDRLHSGKLSTGEGQHMLKVDITLDEFADILGQELKLPDIKNKGQSKIRSSQDRYTGIRHRPRTARRCARALSQTGSRP